MVAIGAIRRSDQRTGVDDQHDSVTAEAVIEQLLDAVTDAVLTRANSDERGCRRPVVLATSGTLSMSTPVPDRRR